MKGSAQQIAQAAGAPGSNQYGITFDSSQVTCVCTSAFSCKVSVDPSRVKGQKDEALVFESAADDKYQSAAHV